MQHRHLARAGLPVHASQIPGELPPPEQLVAIMRQDKKAVAGKLTFLNEHVAVDVGHTLLNEKMLEEAITRSPEQGRIYAETGARAMTAYIHFLGECLRIAEAQVASRVMA